MKRFLLALVFIILFGVLPTGQNNVNAADKIFETPVCMTVNKNYIKSDSPPFLEKGYTLVPIRALSESLCADSVLWDAKSNSAYIKKGSTSLTIKKNSKYAYVNEKKVTLDMPAKIYNDRFYVPVRFASESFGATVSWNNETYTVDISLKGVTVPAHLIGERGYSDTDLYWLSRIINAESQGESMDGKIAVGNVVLNRVESPLYADNIKDVVFDTNYGVQFTPVLNGTIYNKPLGDSIIAAKRALNGESKVYKCLYFLNPDIAENFWIVNNRTFYKSIGNHDFYL